MADPLATPTDFATYIEADVDTANATLVLGYASEIIRDYCGWEISAFTASGVYLDSDGTDIISVPCLHVTDVSTVELLHHDTWTATTDYSWSAMGALHTRCRWPHGFRSVRISYSGGYDTVPAGITAACCSIAARQLNAENLYSEVVGGITETYQRGPSTGIGSEGLSGIEMIVLDRYKLPGRP